MIAASDMRYANKVVVVTGGSRGIGAGCARVFSEAGATVIVASRAVEAGSAIVEELKSNPSKREQVRVAGRRRLAAGANTIRDRAQQVLAFAESARQAPSRLGRG